jgi:ferrochelatase
MPIASRFRPEPPLADGVPATTGVLLCNLGTPDAPTPAAVRRYLREFLSDPRVVEIPRAAWLPILYGVILPLRSAKSASKYASIWLPEGSPLAVWTARQAAALQQQLALQGQRVLVRHAMRYGTPSIAAELDALKAAGATRIVVLSAYPQYSGTTTASLVDAVGEWCRRARNVPELRFALRYFDDAGYIEALASGIEDQWREHGRPDHFVMSFHGVPERTVRLGDPYQRECEDTARRLAARLGLAATQWTLSFQSRFGRAKWLEPSTEHTVRELGKRGVGRIDVACPGFTSDCLETLEEIAMEVRQVFLTSGGREFRYLPCLNADRAWIDALAGIARRQLAGWPIEGR